MTNTEKKPHAKRVDHYAMEVSTLDGRFIGGWDLSKMDCREEYRGIGHGALLVVDKKRPAGVPRSFLFYFDELISPEGKEDLDGMMAMLEEDGIEFEVHFGGMGSWGF